MKYSFLRGRNYRYLFVVAFVLTGVLFYVSNITDYVLKDESRSLQQTFSVNMPGCQILNLNPFDTSILRYIYRHPPYLCSRKRPLIDSNQTSIYVVTEVLQQYEVNSPSDLECCYYSFHRKKPDINNVDSHIDDTILLNTTCVPFKYSANIYDEFVEVRCKKNNETIYRDFHAFVVPKRKNFSSDAAELKNLSVLIIGADTLSRLNFYRQMPKTKYLMEDLGAVEFLGYNKVGENTFPNLVPMLTGHSVEEIRKTCWPNQSDFFDNCPFIWANFSSKNYVTAFAEESCWLGLFNYGKRGFFHQPTDYYLRPYMMANEEWLIRPPINGRYCSGKRFTTEVLISYAYKFVMNMTLTNQTFWGLFWESTLTHDYLNILPLTDDIFYSFFKKLEKAGVLNSTAVIFMSDHGMRWGNIRETYQGRMEEQIPFLHFLLPEWFKKKYSHAMQNLINNTRLLATHFDLHETLKDLLDLKNIENENIELRTSQLQNDRGISLFLPISMNRTCKSAGIAPMYCTCGRDKQIETNDPKILEGARRTVIYLNEMLFGLMECAPLELKKIVSGYIKFREPTKLAYFGSNRYSNYIVTIITKPGDAEFEATFRHYISSEIIKILGVSRINKYGSQSHCVSDVQLKQYCFCV